MTGATVLAWLTAVGTALAGLAACVGVGLAFFTARAWREQARAAKHAEVAGETLAVALSFIRALQRMSNGYRTSATQEADVEHRWATIAADDAAFRALTGRAIAYLPVAASAFVLEVWEKRRKIHVEQSTWAFAIDTQHDKAAELFQVAFGRHVTDELEELEKRAVAILRPLARHENP